LDPRHFGKLDPDPHRSGKVDALEGHFGALEGPNLEKVSGKIRIHIKLKGRIRICIRVKGRTRSRIEVKSRIRIRVKVMRIRNSGTSATRFENIEITVMYDINLFL